MDDVRILVLKNPGVDMNYIFTWLAEFDSAIGEDFTGRFQSLLK
jgi:hypothetical protein